MNRTYKNLIFSAHALERLSGRTITQDAVYQTVTAPAKTWPGKDSTKFIRTVGNRRVHVVAAPIENSRWLIISVWVRGEEDKPSFVWQLLSLPFRLGWWTVRKIFTYFQKLPQKTDL